MSIAASVIILTLNGEQYLKETLLTLRTQLPANSEIFAIDSCSIDTTPTILNDLNVRFIQIPAEEFSHSATRNRAVQMAKGEYVVFLTQDATPQSPDWFTALLSPFKVFPNVAAVYGRQIPRVGADPLESNDLRMAFKDIRHVRSIARGASFTRHSLWDYIHFSNSNSAYERRLLLEQPFDETLPMGEDQEWAKRMLEKNFTIVYEPEATVFHSHEHTLTEKYRRSYEMGASFSSFLFPILGRRKLPVGAWIYHMVSDFAYVATMNAKLHKKITTLFRSPLHRAIAHYAYYRGWNGNRKKTKNAVLQKQPLTS